MRMHGYDTVGKDSNKDQFIGSFTFKENLNNSE
jgi:hypothetical protein